MKMTLNYKTNKLAKFFRDLKFFLAPSIYSKLNLCEEEIFPKLKILHRKQSVLLQVIIYH